MKQKNFSAAALTAAVAAVAGLCFYLVTSLTGFLAGAPLNMPILACSAAGILLLAALAPGRLAGSVKDLAVLAAGLCLIAGMVLFVLDRVSLAADLYFIPVNYPASEQTAFYLSLVGIAGYLAAIVADMVVAFSADEH